VHCIRVAEETYNYCEEPVIRSKKQNI